MDNNQQTDPKMPAVPIATTSPANITYVNTASEGNSGGNKMIMMVIIFVIVLLLLGGGAFYYLSNQKSNTSQPTNQNVSIQTSDLESELNADQPTEVQSDFTEVDKDIQTL